MLLARDSNFSKLNTFSTFDYDDFDLSSVWNNMKNSYITLTPYVVIFEPLSEDKIKRAALTMNPHYIHRMRQTNRKINLTLCEDKKFWVNKIYLDFPTLIFNIY